MAAVLDIATRLPRTRPLYLRRYAVGLGVGPLFFVGQDRFLACDPQARRIEIWAQERPDAAYQRLALEGLRWVHSLGAPAVTLAVHLVEDGAVEPRLALQLCRRLCHLPFVQGLDVVPQPWMPASTLGAILATLRLSGLPVRLGRPALTGPLR